ncbi:MAG: DNA-3-methyladenine glycosylase family protein [bacterium]
MVRDIRLAVSPEFNLGATLLCGQAFRWYENRGGSFTGVIDGGVVDLRKDGQGIFARVEGDPGLNGDRLRDYFDLDLNLEGILRELGKDENVRRAIDLYGEMRILHQSPFECLISFIISANNYIPRIKSTISKLSKTLGEHIARGYHAFPKPYAIAGSNVETLERCGMGFRAKYVWEASRRIASGDFDLEGIGAMPYAEAKERLMELKGVGEKISNCVLLYSMRKYEAFPVDVWIKQVVQDLYFDGADVPMKAISNFASERFGEFAGYAQLYLYHWARMEYRKGRAPH